MDSAELIELLRNRGFNRDVEVEKETWEAVSQDCRSSGLAFSTFLRREEPTYRDDRSRVSIELKDYRDLEGPESFVAELERFNPEHHPLLHLLVDFPNWIWKNRIKTSGPERLDI